MKRIVTALLLLVAGYLPAAAQSTLTSSLSSLPIFLQPNVATDYAVAVDQVNTGGIVSYVVRRVPLSLLVGPAGPPNAIGIGNVATGAPGSSALAYLTGTAPNQLLNLTIPTGAAGPANALSMGAVTSVPYGSPATASITGSSPNQALNIGVPAGAPGPADSIAVGTVTTGAPGSQAVATITGASPTQTLNLTIPQGPVGSTGAAGPQGAAGSQGPAGAAGSPGGAGPANTLSIGTVTTGSAGSAAAASVSGASPNQTLNLTIPTGNTGPQGQTGPQGLTGPQGQTGPQGATGQGFTFRGAWAANTAYSAYDVVTNGGQTYEASSAFTSGATFNAANWNLWAQMGATGATGPQGPAGQNGTGSGNVNSSGTITAGDFAIYKDTTGNVLQDGGKPAAVATSGSASDLGAGTLAAARLPALTGDVTTSAGSAATTLATSGVTAGSYGAANTVPVLTVDAKGRVTAASTASTGTVTSVGLTLPSSLFSVSGSPVTASGTLAASLATQNANAVWAGPTSGNAAAPTFRALTAADLPSGTGTVTSVALALPSSLFTVSGSPVTASGTLTGALATQSPNTVLAGPASGSTAAAPTMRALVSADIPASLALTGTPTTAATPAAGDNSLNLATTAYADRAVATEKSRAQGVEGTLAPLASPTFTGTPKAPTGTAGDTSTQIATDAFVAAALPTAASSADVQTGTNTTRYATSAALSGAQAFQSLTYASTLAWNGQAGYNATVTLTGNATLGAIANPVQGQTYSLLVVQDGTGSRTLAYNAAYDFGAAGTPTLTTAAGKTDMLTLICVSASAPTFYAVLSKGF